MKSPIFLLAFIIHCLPSSGQTFACNSLTQTGQFYGTTYSPYQYHYRPGKRKMLIAGTLALPGGASALIGGLMMITDESAYANDPGYDDGHKLRRNGTYAIGIGTTLIAAGLVLAIMGKQERKQGYSIELVIPRNNEVGVAYNFR